MVNTKGLRRGTRYLFARKFRRHGTEHLSTYLRVYKRGDYVDIKGNGAFPKGLPFKYYHGRTGKIFNVTKRGIGVIVNKRVRHRIIAKRINVRVEHISPSKCRQEFEERKKRNFEMKKQAKLLGVMISCKRQAQQPRVGHFVKTKGVKPEYVEPLPYEFIA